MRHEATATSISWIPSESIWSAMRIGMDFGISHYDDPPPDTVATPDQVHELARRDKLRFANVLTGWVEVVDGAITDAGVADHSGLVMGSTTVRVAKVGATFQAVRLPTLQREPEHEGEGRAVTFRQTVGGRTGVPLPRRVSRKPYVQWSAPTVWTTLALTIRADGSSDVRLAGASAFPRHWVYDGDGHLASKSGITDEKTWLAESFGDKTPWGDQDTPALMVAVESELERQLSRELMHGAGAPQVRRLERGATITRQSDRGDELYLVLDGVVSVEVDGTSLGEVGPGAILGERALLEGGIRTSTLTAVTPVRVAAAPGDTLDLDKLRELSLSHRREDELGAR